MLTRNHVRIGDLAAGTLIVYVPTDAMLLNYVAELTPGVAELSTGDEAP
jgi:hypothetical protein